MHSRRIQTANDVPPASGDARWDAVLMPLGEGESGLISVASLAQLWPETVALRRAAARRMLGLRFERVRPGWRAWRYTLIPLPAPHTAPALPLVGAWIAWRLTALVQPVTEAP